MDPAAAPRAAAAPALRFDLVAGLTAAAVVLPKAMALATVAGLPVAVGLYTSFAPVLVYALLGTSRVLSVSTTTTLAILTGAALGPHSVEGDPTRIVAAAATLAALVGALLALAGLFRLGFVASFISAPVLTGFRTGIGLVIVLDQAPKLLGLHVAKQGFFRDLAHVVQLLPETSLPTLAVGAATTAALVALGRMLPRLPAPLLAVGGAIAASHFLDLAGSGVSIVGAIPDGLPRLTLPDPALVETLLPAAFGIALMSFTESIAAGRAFAAPGDPPVEANRELLATGAANAAGAFFGAMPAGGGTSQTALVRMSGGRSQKASLVTAAAATATMLAFAPLLALMPHATLAAVVIVYSASLIEPAAFRRIRRVRTMEFHWALVACLGVLVFGTLQGIVVAIVVSMVSLAHQAARPPVYVIGRKRGADVLRPLSPEHPDDETFPGLLILRPEGRLFFLNVQHVADQIRTSIAEHHPRVVALDLSRVFDVEYSALERLMEADQRAADDGVTLWLVGLNPGVLEAVRHAGFADRLGRERLLFNARVAIERWQQMQRGATSAHDAAPPSPA